MILCQRARPISRWLVMFLIHHNKMALDYETDVCSNKRRVLNVGKAAVNFKVKRK
ncbi:hypothetical protein AALP_AA6G169700 [Arabis alpina]|uniref:Uncharacterized protein n=1 Tax=Arabis alpina TaxID=50452 RepID=A0A087GPS2_ARAAL|nr:hypothetical protein AALP_AA6G169700 [Arabis alpina]